MSLAVTRRRWSAARTAVVCFIANGLLVGVWAGSLAGLRDRVGTDAAGVAVALVVCGVAAIASMQFAGRYADRHGAVAPSLAGCAAMSGAVAVLSWAPSYAVLVGAALLFGVGNGAMDVAMNALGVDAETRGSRPIMSRLHACFSVGSFAGAAFVLGFSVVSPDPWPALLVAAACGAGTAWELIRKGHADALGSSTTSGRSESQASIPPVAWALGTMAVCFGLSEGTAMDWSAIHVTDVADVEPGIGAAGLVAVSAAMVAIRFVGDRIVSRFGRAPVVQIGAGLAAVGYVGTVVLDGLGPLLVSWLVVGLGVGLIAPQIYGVAGHLGGGRVLAIVTGFGYSAFLAGPALIGFTSAHWGIQRTMLVPVVAALALSAMAASRILRR